MTAAELTGLVIALGSAPVVLKIIDWLKATRSGRAVAEKEQNQSLLSRVVNAEKRFDLEAEFRRAVEEWAGGLVYLLKQIGVPEDKIPPKPTRKAD